MDLTLDLVLTVFNSKECLRTFSAVRCPPCHSEQIVKRGITRRGTQRSCIPIMGMPTSSIWHLQCRAQAHGTGENRAPASDLADTYETLGPQDHQLRYNYAAARHRHGRVGALICLWTDGLTVASSTVRRSHQRHLDKGVSLTMSKLSTKLHEEFIALLPPTIFFFVALHLVAMVRVLMLKGTGIALSTPLQVTLGALILGKAVLVADLLPFINRYPESR